MSETTSRLRRVAGSLLAVITMIIGLAMTGTASSNAQGTLPPYSYSWNTIFQLELSGSMRCHTNRIRSDIGPESWSDGYYVRTDFQNTKQIFSTGSALYRIATNGDLYWYGDIYSVPCTGPWTPPNGAGGRKLENPPGWQNWKKVFPGPSGVIYALRSDNTVWWYRHTGYNSGANTWAAGSGTKKVGDGWTWNPSTITSSGDGQFYAVTNDGRLLWLRHIGWETGEYIWYWPDMPVGGIGWNMFHKLFASEDGQIYGVDASGRLWWCRHTGYRHGQDTWQSCRIAHDQANWLVFITDHAILRSSPSPPVVK